MSKYIFFIPLIILLNSCASVERASDSQSESELPFHANSRSQLNTGSKEGELFNEQSINNPAVKALLMKAKQQEQHGDLEGAELSLERALRISPRAVQVHFDLASVRLKQGNAYSALQLALKGQSYVRDSRQASLFWRLIGDCYTALGNVTKASEAYSHL